MSELSPPKLVDLDRLAALVADRKARGRRVVHCHGCFDLLHIGHLRYLRQAGRMGDVLVVTVSPDRYVDKGPGRPAFSENLRAEAVASLDCVDFVAVNRWPTAQETLRLLRPDIYVKGSDFTGVESDPTGKLADEQRVAAEIGAELAFTDDVVFSSTNLINRFLSRFPEEVRDYLNLFRSRYRIEAVHEWLDAMRSLRVLVVGDTILDDYHYCHTLGTSSKDPVLAVQFDSSDMFPGGVLAVANHLANFVRSVDLVSVIGQHQSHERFITAQLAANVTPHFIVQPGAPTLIKRRFVEGYSLNKLFEVYIMDDSGLPPDRDRRLREITAELLPRVDLVLAADFGHGAISADTRQLLVDRSPFLAVNTQANSGNRGFHTVTRYPRADYVSIAEHEMRLEMRDVRSKVTGMVPPVARKMGCRQFVVTRGRKGCVVVDRNGEIVEVPAFAQEVVDRIGAGDAFLSVTSLAARLGAPAEVIGFLGNAVGALAVQILGNQKAIDPMSLKKYTLSLLK